MRTAVLVAFLAACGPILVAPIRKGYERAGKDMLDAIGPVGT